MWFWVVFILYLNNKIIKKSIETVLIIEIICVVYSIKDQKCTMHSYLTT